MFGAIAQKARASINVLLLVDHIILIIPLPLIARKHTNGRMIDLIAYFVFHSLKLALFGKLHK